MDPDKIKVMVERQPPKNKKGLQEILGSFNYYRGFIKNMASGDDHDVEYVCSYASRSLKGAEVHYGITEKECLAVVWAIKYFFVYVSGFMFRVYVSGTKFNLVTDHIALKWLMDVKEATGRLARWALYLQSFDFTIVFRQGKNHANVDAVSRPVLLINVEKLRDDDGDLDVADLDYYEDDGLMYYLKMGSHRSGISYKHVKRIKKMAERLSLEIDDLGREQFFIQIQIRNKRLIVPKPSERLIIVERAHLLGHFQEYTTMKRIRQDYFWQRMNQDVKQVINACEPCRRNQKVRVVEHSEKVLSLEI